MQLSPLQSIIELITIFLTEVGAGEFQSLLILNKIDRLIPEQKSTLTDQYPEFIFLSVKKPQDVAALRLQLL